MANEEIRKLIKQSKLRHWEVADLLGISETTFVRKLRYELPKAEKEKILKIINKNK